MQVFMSVKSQLSQKFQREFICMLLVSKFFTLFFFFWLIYAAAKAIFEILILRSLLLRRMWIYFGKVPYFDNDCLCVCRP